MSESAPDALRTDSVDRFDVFLSFTRATPRAEEHSELIENALTARGLTVFRDVRIDDFDGITSRLVSALSGSTFCWPTIPGSIPSDTRVSGN